MSTLTQIQNQIKESQFEEEVIVPMANEIIEKITSHKLTYKQTNSLIRLIRDKIEDAYITF